MGVLFCSSCGTKCDEDATFCHKCGAAIRHDEEPVPAVQERKKGYVKERVLSFVQKFKEKNSPTLVRNIILLVVSLLLLVTVFTPIISFPSVRYYEGTTRVVRSRESGIDIILYCIDGLISKDTEQLNASSLKREYDELTGIISEYKKDPNTSYGTKIERMLLKEDKLATRIILQRKDVGVPVNCLALGILWFIYIAVILALLVFSVKNIFDFVYKDKDRPGFALLALCLLPGIVLGFWCLVRLTASNEIIGSIFEIPAGFLVVFATVVVVTAVVACFVLGIVARRSFNIGGIVTRGCSIALVLLLFMLTFMPCVDMHLTTTFGGKTGQSTAKAPMDLRIYTSLVPDGMSYEEMRTHISNILSKYSYGNLVIPSYSNVISKTQFEEDTFAQTDISDFAIYSIGEETVGDSAFSHAFLLFLIPSALLCICLGILLAQNLMYLTDKRECKAATIAVKVVALLLVFLILILNIAMVISTNIAIDHTSVELNNGNNYDYNSNQQNSTAVRLSDALRFTIGGAPIVMVVVAIALMAIPSIEFVNLRLRSKRNAEEDSQEVVGESTEEEVPMLEENDATEVAESAPISPEEQGAVAPN